MVNIGNWLNKLHKSLGVLSAWLQTVLGMGTRRKAALSVHRFWISYTTAVVRCRSIFPSTWNKYKQFNCEIILSGILSSNHGQESFFGTTVLWDHGYCTTLSFTTYVVRIHMSQWQQTAPTTGYRAMFCTTVVLRVMLYLWCRGVC